jgi:hypothetical protein
MTDDPFELEELFRSHERQPSQQTRAMDLDEAEQIVRDWAAAQPRVIRAWIFGSYCKGKATVDSDLDVAFELDIPDDAEPEWAQVGGDGLTSGTKLDRSLRNLVPTRLDLQRYAGDRTPNMKTYLSECALLVYEADNQGQRRP